MPGDEVLEALHLHGRGECKREASDGQDFEGAFQRGAASAGQDAFHRREVDDLRAVEKRLARHPVVRSLQPRFHPPSENRLEGFAPHIVSDIKRIEPGDVTFEH